MEDYVAQDFFKVIERYCALTGRGKQFVINVWLHHTLMYYRFSG
jgi:hypothetical protein